MKLISILSTVALAITFSACSPSVKMPKGTSKGYHSARLVKMTPNSTVVLSSKEKQIHSEIQSAIKNQFISHGKSFGQANSDLVVGYLIIAQNNAMTTAYSEYFGYGRDAQEITDIAHLKGVVEGVRPDFFERATLLVDVIDAKTNKLVYRNYVLKDVTKGATPAIRQKNINAAVATALAPFFKK